MTATQEYQLEALERAWLYGGMALASEAEENSSHKIVHCDVSGEIKLTEVGETLLGQSFSRVTPQSLLIVSLDSESKIVRSQVTEILSRAFFQESLIYVEGKTCFWIAKTERAFVRQRQNSSESARLINLTMEQAIETVAVWSARKRGIRPSVLPKIVILGVQKCGTTALFDMLTQHPKLAGGESGGRVIKEIGFFNRYYERGLSWYQSYFRRPGVHYIDATVDYSATREFLERIRRDLPSAKFLYIMRDPVERVYSAWNFWHRLPAYTKRRWKLPAPEGTFEENLRKGMENEKVPGSFWGFIARGYYDQQIDVMQELFEPERLHFCFNEDLRADPQQQLNRIFDYVGVERHSIRSRERNSSAYKVDPMSESTERWLEEVYAATVRNLSEKHGLDLPWRRW